MKKWVAISAVGLLFPVIAATREAQLHLLPTGDTKSNAILPTTRPATRPVARVAFPTTRPAAKGGLELPPQFALLLSRSVFSKTGKSAGAVAGPPVPEALMALRGIVFDESSFVAFIEDSMSHRTLQVRSGESLCSGCVRQISLDGLSFENGGKTIHVGIGQNLLGAALPAPQAPPQAGPPGPPPGPVGPPPPGAGPPGRGPVYGIGPNGQRIREYSQERKGPQ